MDKWYKQLNLRVTQEDYAQLDRIAEMIRQSEHNIPSKAEIIRRALAAYEQQLNTH